MASKASLTVESVDNLLKALLVLSRAVDRVLETQAVDSAAPHRLSSSKVQVLRLLAQRSGQTSSQIARFLGVSKPAVSQIVDSMVRGRLVARKTAKADRREIHLRLTEKGKALFKSVRKEQRHYVRTALREANGADPAQWIKTMNDVTQALAQADTDFQEFCLQCGAHADGTCVLIGGAAACHFMGYEPRSVIRGKKRVAQRS